MTPLPDGVYLNLPEELHRADPALGYTDLKAILTSPVQWHAKNRNPIRLQLAALDKPDTLDQRFGRALHTIALEGEEAFSDRYFVPQAEPDDLLDTKPEMRSFLEGIGVAVPSKWTRDELMNAIKVRGYGDQLLDVWKDGNTVEAAGREPISAEWDWTIRTVLLMLSKHSKAAKYLSNGRPEVTIIWTDATGLRLKARLDYLRVRAVVDLKKHGIRDGMDPVESFIQTAQVFGYDFQAPHYMDARAEIPRLVGEGSIFEWSTVLEAVVVAGRPDREFMHKVAAEPDPHWIWIACNTLGLPEVDTIPFGRDLLAYAVAQAQVEEAKRKYREFRERFGDDDAEMWIEDRGLVQLDDSMFSRRSSERGLQKWLTIPNQA